MGAVPKEGPAATGVWVMWRGGGAQEMTAAPIDAARSHFVRIRDFMMVGVFAVYV